MADPKAQADWAFLEAMLPKGWRDLASEMGLVRKLPPHIGQKVLDIATALRLVLHYVAQRGSMRKTTASAAVAGIVTISQPALFKWMFKIGAYLEALVARMVEPGRFSSAAWGGYVLIAADATSVSRPGAKGTTARLHYALHLSDLRPRCIRITDDKVGETMRNYDVEPGELWIVDRGYSNPPSVLDCARKGGAILVRFNRHSLPVYDAHGDRIDVPRLVTATPRRGRTQHRVVRVIGANGEEVRAQLCWVWLPKPAADKARAHAARDGERDPAELDLAEYFIVLTTAPTSRLTAEQAIELYGARWQIELDFKRDKSIGELDQLPSELPETIRSWLCAKVLLDLLARRLAAQPVALPPSGLADAILPALEAPPAARSRRRAVVRDAVRLGGASPRAAAHSHVA
jgi:hypothetical protein